MNRKYLVFLWLGLLIFLFQIMSKFLSVEYSGARASAPPAPFAIGKANARFSIPRSLVSVEERAASFGGEAPPPLNEDQGRDEKRFEALCALKKSGTSVPMWGSPRVFISRISQGPNAGDFIAWIKSDSCPEDSYSILQFSPERGISREIDCRNTSLTQLMKMSGEQSEIEDIKEDPGMKFFAISGNGYFVSMCPDRRFRLTRDGKFARDGSRLINADGCVLLNQEGGIFEVHGRVDRLGCSPFSECIGILDPFTDDIEGLSRLDSQSFTADSIASLDVSLMRVQRPTLFQNALENLDDPERGPTGIRWNQHPQLNLDEIQCAQ